MSTCRLMFSTVLAAALGATAMGQTPMPPVRGGAPGTVPARRPRQEPCWQVAGVSKSAMEQERVMHRQAKQEVEAVCANSSLSLQQKREQIREIHMREKQQSEGLISPAQREAMRSCQAERGHGGGHAVGGGGHGGGPCGEMAVPQKGAPPQNEKED